MAFLSGWNYRKKITLSNSGGSALTDYQVKFTVNRSTGTDSGFTTYVGTKCDSTYKDIRFTKSDGTTLLNYWIESSNSSTATIWVKVDSIPASGTADIFLYYGNSSATAVSNGVNTFITFDDFEDGTITNWSATGLASYTETGGQLVLEANTYTYATPPSAYMARSINLSDGFVAEASCNYVGRSSDLCQIYLYLTDGTNYLLSGVIDSGEGFNPRWDTAINSSINAGTAGSKPASGSFTTKIIRDESNNVSLYVDGVQRLTGTQSSTYTSLRLTNSRYQTYNGKTAKWNYVLIRKYVSTEPTVSSYGSEQLPITLTTTLLPDKSVRLSWT